MIYDITSKLTFDEIKENYSKIFKEHFSLDTIIIIAEKILPHLFYREEVYEIDAREFASSINATFTLVSKKYLHSFNELFFENARKYTSC